MSKSCILVVATVLLLAATQVEAVTLTFEDLAEGALLSNQYEAQGAVFSATAFTGPGTSSSGSAWATNTDMTIVSSLGTDVGGMGTPRLVSGNILRSFAGWRLEDGDPNFQISFATPVDSFSATFDGVSTAADVTLYAYDGGTLLGTVSGTGSDPGVKNFVLSFSAASISSVVIRPGAFNDWVAVDDITFTQVPEPGSCASMAMVLSLLILRLRRQA